MVCGDVHFEPRGFRQREILHGRALGEFALRVVEQHLCRGGRWDVEGENKNKMGERQWSQN